MGFLKYTFSSAVLNCTTSVTITLPDFAIQKTGLPLDEIYTEQLQLPTIYLLHGGAGDSSDWLRHTQIELLGNEKGFMTVSFDAMESFYTDMVHGRDYFTYATEEVPRVVQRLFHSSPRREDNFVAGFSMGGHGAMKLALRCPERYKAVLALSGAKDMVKMAKLAEQMGIKASSSTIDEAFGSIDNIYNSENDLMHLALELKRTGKEQPEIYLGCGTEDYGYELCREYSIFLEDNGLQNQFISISGKHDYFFVNRMITKAVNELFVF